VNHHRHLVAYARTHEDEPRIVLAEDEYVLTRAVALEIVASTPAHELVESDLGSIRKALLEERWADAMTTWMTATGIAIDIFTPELTVWSNDLLDEETTALELRMAAIFRSRDDSTGGDAI
jgi:hypothetical protein